MAKFAPWSRLSKFILGTHALALIDQALVSGASFITTIFVGRWADPSQLGIYSIGTSLLVSILTIQDSLITLPYTIHRQQRLGAAAEHAGSSFAHNSILSALAAFVLTLAAIGLSHWDPGSQLEPALWMLAAIIAFALLREFGRRVAFAELDIQRALALDATVVILQISGLAFLAWINRMSAETAFGTIGLASALPSLLWFFFNRIKFAVSAMQAKIDLKSNWALAKWLLAGQVMMQAQSYAAQWLTLAIVGAAGTGAFAAAASIVALANPFIAAFSNILTPRAVHAWNSGGRDAVRAQAIRDALLLASGTGLFCLIIFWSGADLLSISYHSDYYREQGGLLNVLVVALLMSVVGVPASNALAAIQQPRLIVWASSVGALATLVLVWALTAQWGLLGAGYGLLIGNMVGSIGRWVAFGAATYRHDDFTTSVVGVVLECVPDCDVNGLEISLLDEGTHAHVYRVRSKSGAPVWKAYDALIIKLFKAEAALDASAARAQVQSLSRLNTTLDNLVAGGWRLSVPTVLYICQAPLAIVMTEAPGRNLNEWVKTGEGLTSELLKDIAGATIEALRQCWARKQVHGDFALQNILCDTTNRTLSIIDAGTRESCRICNVDGSHWSPAARDLANLLADVATDVKQSIGNSSSRRLRQIFAVSAISAFLSEAETREVKKALLRDIEDCAHAHLNQLLELSWSLRGLWRLYIKHVAVRRMRLLLKQLSVDADA